MPYNLVTQNWDISDEMGKLLVEKRSSIELQKRKHEDWNDNYELYRNKVKTNRLTQRQAVNIPLMKETIKTLLSKIDDPPIVEWKELGGDDERSLIYQAVWDENFKRNKLELIDILDKKNVLLYGLSAKKLNLCEYGVEVSVLDIFDLLIDPLYNPWDLNSARFLIQQNIFRTAREILADPKYSEKGKEELKIWLDSPPGITQGNLNKEQFDKKMERLKAMGVASHDFAYFAGGDRIVNLTEHFSNVWNSKKQAFEKRVIVYAEDKIELYNETLMDCLGVDEWPFVIWSEDPEATDVYPDSVADLIRTPNKVLNVWLSQMIENRTLKNFQMHWYLPGNNYQPQTYTPGPGVMLPAPPGDDVNKVIKPVEISGLDDTMDAINMLTQIVERGTGATAIDKGQPEKGTQTLGEVQILVGKANERATAMAKFYRMAWYELAKKWDMIMQANAPKILDLYKTSKTGKMFPKRVYANDWTTKTGYEPTVKSTSEQELSEVKTVQKWLFVLGQFPNNPALKRIAQKRELELLDLTPEELREVEEAEKKMEEEARVAAAAPAPEQPNPQLLQEVNQKMGMLQMQ